MRARARGSKGRRRRPALVQGRGRAAPASGDERGRGTQQAGERRLGKRNAAVRVQIALGPGRVRSIRRGQIRHTDAVAAVAIGMWLQCLIDRCAGIVSGRVIAVAVLVVAEMGGPLLMLAHAGRSRPTPLEGQKAHHENEDEAAH